MLIAPFAPHIAEELWQQALGNEGSVFDAAMPKFNAEHLVENSFEYPVSINGKLRFKKTIALGLSPKEVEAEVLADPAAEKWMEGKPVRKVIVVPGKIVNIVI